MLPERAGGDRGDPAGAVGLTAGADLPVRRLPVRGRSQKQRHTSRDMRVGEQSAGVPSVAGDDHTGPGIGSSTNSPGW